MPQQTSDLPSPTMLGVARLLVIPGGPVRLGQLLMQHTPIVTCLTTISPQGPAPHRPTHLFTCISALTLPPDHGQPPAASPASQVRLSIILSRQRCSHPCLFPSFGFPGLLKPLRPLEASRPHVSSTSVAVTQLT